MVWPCKIVLLKALVNTKFTVYSYVVVVVIIIIIIVVVVDVAVVCLIGLKTRIHATQGYINPTLLGS